jgi:SAM-dependent methyltransferase
VGAVFVLFALCFTNDPLQVFFECARVLKTGGHLVLGMVPSTGPWGQALLKKKENRHPFYEYARFYDEPTVLQMLDEAGFCLVESRSSLFQLPDDVHEFERSVPGSSPNAGFLVLVARKRE